jgi:hypothetical protein
MGVTVTEVWNSSYNGPFRAKGTPTNRSLLCAAAVGAYLCSECHAAGGSSLRFQEWLVRRLLTNVISGQQTRFITGVIVGGQWD